jgi:ubiquinone/menaquinone biosynthesis C-methylase UbiE
MGDMRKLVAVALLLGAASIAATARQQTVAGKHPISGRRYATVMGFEGAEWLDRAEREEEEEPNRAITALDLQNGNVVADIGAGSGYMTIRMAKQVGPMGRVYAEDIQPQMLDLLGQRMEKAGVMNVVPVLGLINDPKLPASTLDLELLVDVYHEFSEPQQMLRGLRDALKPDGRLVLLEYREEDPDVPIKPEHKMSVSVAKLEVEHEGFKLAKVDERLPRQHILFFTKQNR